MSGARPPDWLRDRARAVPQRPAIVSGSQELSFGQLDGRTDEIAAALRAAGIKPRDRIAVLARPTVDLVACIHAIGRVGAVLMPLNSRLRPQDQQRLLMSAAATHLLHEHSDASAASLSSGEGIDITAELRLARLRGGGGGLPSWPAETPLDEPQFIMPTSGTTGTSKVVVLTYGNTWWNAMGSALNLGASAADRWLDCLPLFHVGGLSILIRGVLSGVPVTLHGRFDPEAVNAEIDRGHITLVSLVSTMLDRMLELRCHRPFPHSLRCVLLGGGPIPASLMEACMDAGIPVAPTYGMTETASQVTTLRPAEVRSRPASAGRPLLGARVAIKTASEQARPGEIGEILVGGPCLSPARFSPETGLERTGGWLSTGDLGVRDEEGFLTVLDRRVDLIVTGGENVAPSEVEAILVQHPGVRRAAVFPLADSRWGQIVAAAVEPTGDTTDEAILAFCRSRLPAFKVPKRVHILEELPLSASGKVLRTELRRRFEGGENGARETSP